MTDRAPVTLSQRSLHHGHTRRVRRSLHEPKVPVVKVGVSSVSIQSKTEPLGVMCQVSHVNVISQVSHAKSNGTYSIKRF